MISNPMVAFAGACMVAGVLAGWFGHGAWYGRSGEEVVCRLHDGREVQPAKFIRAHGNFASSTGVCSVRGSK